MYIIKHSNLEDPLLKFLGSISIFKNGMGLELWVVSVDFGTKHNDILQGSIEKVCNV